MNFRFNDPAYLMWLWGLPGLIMIFVWRERVAASRIRKGFGEKMAPILIQSVSVVKRRWKFLSLIAALFFFILALARPQMGQGQTTVKAEGVEIVIAFDVSTSMMAEDVKPSRLEHAKLEVMRLLDSFSGDKVALVAFAGSAAMISPLTSDKSALKMFVESLSIESVETQGTEFRKAFREARAAFERGGIDPDEGVRVTRVLLLVSDGEDQEPGAIEEAKKLAGEGIRIFSFAIGTEKGGAIPLRDERGFLRGYKKDRSGVEIVTRVKGTALRDLAEAGRGSFYFSNPGGNEMRSLKGDLDKLEKAQFASEQATQFDERFQIPLGVGLVFMILFLLLGERRAASQIWRGRFSSPVKSILFLALTATGGGASVAQAAGGPIGKVEGVYLNNEGVGLFAKERYFEAFQKFAKSLAQNPFSPVVHFNLADTFLLNKEYEKAIAGFDEAIKQARIAGDLAIEFQSRFNQGVAATDMKNIDKALEYYQHALTILPNSNEVKTNIELLIQQQQNQSQDGEGDNKDPKSKDGKGQDDNKDKKDDKKDGKDKKDDKGEGDKKPEGPPQNGKKPEPKPFQSKDIGEQDVKRILDELKSQEEQVRAKYQREGSKDAPRDKDW